VLLPKKHYKRKQKKCYYWGEDYKKMLPPGKRYKTKVINVLLPRNVGDENKGNIITKNTSYEAYDINKVLLPGEYYRREL